MPAWAHTPPPVHINWLSFHVELDQVDAETLAKQQQEQDAMVEQQQNARPLLQKQNEMSLSQNQPVLVDNDEELDKILEASTD